MLPIFLSLVQPSFRAKVGPFSYFQRLTISFGRDDMRAEEADAHDQSMTGIAMNETFVQGGGFQGRLRLTADILTLVEIFVVRQCATTSKSTHCPPGL